MSRPKKPATSAGFNLFNRSVSFNSAVKEALVQGANRVKYSPGAMYGAMPSNRTLLLPIKDFGMQYLANSRGFMGGRILDIIGADGVGKSTLIFTMMGWWMEYNIVSQYIEAESKPPMRERIMRALNSSREIATTMFEQITFDEAHEILVAVYKAEQWIRMVRNPESGEAFVPMQIPVATVIDSWSKLMCPSEAVGYHLYTKMAEDTAKGGKKSKKQKTAEEKEKEAEKFIQELGGGSNFEHAKLTHRWMRRLPSFLTAHNAFIVFVRHQNTKIDMGGGGSMVPTEVAEQYNRTSIGGKALDQSAAWQWIITKDKGVYAQVRGERELIGRLALIKTSKNSQGPERKLLYAVIQVPRDDTETYQEPAIDFSSGIVDTLKRTGMLHVADPKTSEVTVKELNITAATPREVLRALNQRPDLINEIGSKLNMMGFDPMYQIPAINPIFDVGAAKTKAETEAKE